MSASLQLFIVITPANFFTCSGLLTGDGAVAKRSGLILVLVYYLSKAGITLQRLKGHKADDMFG